MIRTHEERIRSAERRVVEAAMRWYKTWCVTEECSRLARDRIRMPNGVQAALAVAVLKLERTRGKR